MTNINVLVVDDSSTMRRIVAKALMDLGLSEDHITQAVDGVDALEKLKAKKKFDLVLTDWNMPKMDGLALVNNIKLIPESQDIPIVMITTEGSKKEVIEALKSGVNNYLVKPFNLETLKIKLFPILKKIENKS